MKKKILFGVGILVLVIASLIGYIGWASRNTAKAEADIVLNNFTQATNSQWYCENGSGKGIDNDTPWWEQIYLSDTEPELVAKSVEKHLAGKGYNVNNTFVEKIDRSIDDGTLIRQGKDWYNRDYSYWKIEGNNHSFTVVARVSEDLTLNNCFKSSNKDTSKDPDDFNTKVVIKFRDEI